MAYRIQNKNPIDLVSNNRAKIGISIPFTSPSVFSSTFSTNEQIKYNLINLILTQKGEIPFLNDFGTNLRKMVFEQDGAEDDISNDINITVYKYIPQITVTTTLIDKIDNLINIKIEYRINLTGETNNINLTFE